MNASVDDVKEFVAENQQAALAMAESFFRTTADQLEYWVIPPAFRVSGLGERVILIAAPRSERAARAPESRRERVTPEREGRREGSRDRDRDRGPREPRRERERDRDGERERETPRPARAESLEPAPSGPLGEIGKFVAGLLERMKAADVSVSEAQSDGETIVTLGGRAITSLAEQEPRLAAALSHLAHRAAEALIGEDATAQVEIRGARRPAREESRERGGREGREGRDRRGPRRDGRRDDRGPRSRDGEDRDIDEAELERLAHDVARSVRESGEAELLPPMNSRERWFVHNALKDERGVRSESEGEGARKRVKIFPA
jgi:spoIIIJ-associated protein